MSNFSMINFLLNTDWTCKVMATRIEIIGNELDLFDDECPLPLRDRVHPEDFALVIYMVNRMALRMQRLYFQVFLIMSLLVCIKLNMYGWPCLKGTFTAIYMWGQIHQTNLGIVFFILLFLQQAPWYRFGFLDGWFNITHTLTDDGAVSNDDIDSIRDAICEFLYEENIKHWCVFTYIFPCIYPWS